MGHQPGPTDNTGPADHEDEAADQGDPHAGSEVAEGQEPEPAAADAGAPTFHRMWSSPTPPGEDENT